MQRAFYTISSTDLWAVFHSHLCQFCQGLCITPVDPLQAVHGTLREGSRTGKLADVTFSCTPFRHAHQTWTNPLQLHWMGLYQGAKRRQLKDWKGQMLLKGQMLQKYACMPDISWKWSKTNLWTQTCSSLLCLCPQAPHGLQSLTSSCLCCTTSSLGGPWNGPLSPGNRRRDKE